MTENKLVIELVDTGGVSGQPPTPPDSSTPSAPAPEPGGDNSAADRSSPSAVKFDELLKATQDMAASLEPVAKMMPSFLRVQSGPDGPGLEATRRPGFHVDPSEDGGLSFTPTPAPFDPDEDQYGATQGPQRPQAGVPIARRQSAAELSEIQMNKATAEYAQKVSKKLLSYDEALAELAKLVKSRGLALTELLRSRGMATTQTATDHYQGQFRDAVKQAGLPVPANWTEPLKPSDLRPVAMPKPDREIPIAQKSQGQLEKEEAERRSKLTLAAVATQNIVQGGPGQKAAGAVQLAGSGLLGPQAAALAGGPVGTAVQIAGLVVDMVDAGIRKAGETVRSGIRTAGEMGSSVAKNDGMGAFTKGIDGAAGALGKIPIVGTAAAEGLKVFTTAINTARETINAFAERGRELRGYNPAIAQAAAIADVKKIQMDIAEANRFSAQYVKMIEAQSRIDAAWRRATDPIRARIMEFLANKLAPWLERMGERVERIMNTADLMGAIADNFDKLLNLDFDGFKGAIDKRLKDIVDEVKKRDQPQEAGMKAVESWYTRLDQMQFAPAPAEPGDRNLKLPIFAAFGED